MLLAVQFTFLVTLAFSWPKSVENSKSFNLSKPAAAVLSISQALAENLIQDEQFFSNWKKPIRFSVATAAQEDSAVSPPRHLKCLKKARPWQSLQQDNCR
jgi:hypothetical protein